MPRPSGAPLRSCRLNFGKLSFCGRWKDSVTKKSLSWPMCRSARLCRAWRGRANNCRRVLPVNSSREANHELPTSRATHQSLRRRRIRRRSNRGAGAPHPLLFRLRSRLAQPPRFKESSEAGRAVFQGSGGTPQECKNRITWPIRTATAAEVVELAECFDHWGGRSVSGPAGERHYDSPIGPATTGARNRVEPCSLVDG